MKSLARLHMPKLSKEEVSKIVKKAAATIRSLCEPDSVILFGSALTEEFDEYSDLDLVVIFRTETEAREGQRILYRNTDKFPCSIDFVCVDRETYERKSAVGGVLWIARNEGRVL